MAVDFSKFGPSDLKKISAAARSSDGDKVLKQVRAAKKSGDELKKESKTLADIAKTNPDV